MAQYLALLRGINVGGKSLIKMADLKVALTDNGFEEVKTYIQSGNVFVSTPETDLSKIAKSISRVIKKHFEHDVEVVVFSKKEWKKVISSAPEWWGVPDSKDWRHNLLVMLPPFDMKSVMKEIGEPLEDVEFMKSGVGVVYASHVFAATNRTRLHKVISLPVYKRMTVRNYNTSTKLLTFFD